MPFLSVVVCCRCRHGQHLQSAILVKNTSLFFKELIREELCWLIPKPVITEGRSLERKVFELGLG